MINLFDLATERTYVTQPLVDSATQKLKKKVSQKDKKLLNEIILETLQNIESIRVTKTTKGRFRLTDINRVDEFLIDFGYLTQFAEYLYDRIIKRSKRRFSSLVSMDNVKRKLSENPVIGNPLYEGTNFLVYQEVAGFIEKDLYYEKETDEGLIFDRVIIHSGSSSIFSFIT